MEGSLKGSSVSTSILLLCPTSMIRREKACVDLDAFCYVCSCCIWSLFCVSRGRSVTLFFAFFCAILVCRFGLRDVYGECFDFDPIFSMLRNQGSLFNQGHPSFDQSRRHVLFLSWMIRRPLVLHRQLDFVVFVFWHVNFLAWCYRSLCFFVCLVG